jgi:hypothetical protein
LRREPPEFPRRGEIDDADPPEADLVNTADGQTFQNCSPARDVQRLHRLHRPGSRAARGLVKDSFGRSLYAPQEAARRKLSDHCPVFIRLRVADATAASS